MDASPPTPAYLWFDTEFSSLDFERASLLQVALVMTDVHLQRRAGPEDDLNLHVRPDPDGEPLSPWVRENLGHVLVHCRGAAAVPAAAVDGVLCEYLDRRLGPPDPDIRARPVIAGNSVHADYYLSRLRLPGFLERVHYRILDVSSVKLMWCDMYGGEAFDKDRPDLVRAWFPGAALPVDGLAHDAYYDVQASIAELAYYRAHLARVQGEAPQ
jgi:oligoribonuclease